MKSRRVTSRKIPARKTGIFYALLGFSNREQPFHVWLERSLDRNGFSSFRMRERKPPRVEHLAVDPVFAFGERVFSGFPVGFVAEYRRVERSEVHAYLVRPPGFYPAREERVFSGNFRFERFVMGDGRLSRFVDADLGFVLRVFHPEQFFSDRTARILRSPSGDRGVRLVHFVVLKGCEEPIQSSFRFGDQYDPGGVAVDAVDERWPEGEGVEISGVVVGYGFDERILIAFVVARMDVEPCRFVDGEDETVFEEDAVLREGEFRP